MWTYVTDELPALLAENFAIDMDRQSITGSFDGWPRRADDGDGVCLTGSGPCRRLRQSVTPHQSDWGRKQITQPIGDAEERLGPA